MTTNSIPFFLSEPNNSLPWLQHYKKSSDTLIQESIEIIYTIDLNLAYVLEAHEIYRRSVLRNQNIEYHKLSLKRVWKEREQYKGKSSKFRELTQQINKIKNKVRPSWRHFTQDDLTKFIQIYEMPEATFDNKTIALIHEHLTLLLEKQTEKGDFYYDVKRWSAEVRSRLRNLSYFTQQTNKPFISKRIKDKGKNSWEYTCNITSLAMLLDYFGITPFHLIDEFKLILIDIYAHLEEKVSSIALWSEITNLRFPDFLQLVAITHTFLNPEKEDYKTFVFEKRIRYARYQARKELPGKATIFENISKMFSGIKKIILDELYHSELLLPLSQELHVHNQKHRYDSFSTSGRELHKNKVNHTQELKKTLGKLLSQLWLLEQWPENTQLEEALNAIGYTTQRQSNVKIIENIPNLTYSEGPHKGLKNAIDERGNIGMSSEELTIFTVKYVLVQNELSKSKLKKTVREKAANEIWGIESKQILNERLTRLKWFIKTKNHEIPKIWHKCVSLFNLHLYGSVSLYQTLRENESWKSAEKPVARFIKFILNKQSKTRGLIRGGNKTNGMSLKSIVIQRIKPLLERGAGIIINRPGHYVFLLDVTHTGIIVHDPAFLISQNKSKGRRTYYNWMTADKMGFFRAIHIFMRN